MNQYLDPKKRDLADYQDEMAGRETGRQERFFTGEASRRDNPKEKRRRRGGLSTLERLLLDPIYARAYEQTWDALERLQAAIDAALLRSSESVEQLERLVIDLETRAARLSDGTPVFASADGGIYAANGRRLSDNEAASLHIPADSPSWEQFRDARHALDAARAHRDRVLGIERDIAAPGFNRLNDRVAPPSLDDLSGLENEFTDALSGVRRPSLTSVFDDAPASEPALQTALNLDFSAYKP